MKSHSSVKPHLYGFKMEDSVLSIGLAINYTRSHPKAPAHVAISRANKNGCMEFLQKFDNEDDLIGRGKNTDQFSHSWAVLMDKRYTGADGDLRAIIPSKKNFQRVALSIRS